MPLLIKHLSSSNYVVYSYAATTIERILFIKQNGQTLYVLLLDHLRLSTKRSPR
jgi:hypothetical protein